MFETKEIKKEKKKKNLMVKEQKSQKKQTLKKKKKLRVLNSKNLRKRLSNLTIFSR